MEVSTLGKVFQYLDWTGLGTWEMDLDMTIQLHLEGLHSILISEVITGEDDPNVLAPVHPKCTPQNVDGGVTLIHDKYYII